MVCRTCRIVIHLGYGSPSTWLGECCRTKEEFDKISAVTNLRKMRKNQNVRQALVEHEGHDFEFVSTDWTQLNGKDLVLEGPYGRPGALIAKDYCNYSEDNWSRIGPRKT